jgi:hypothetical protein
VHVCVWGGGDFNFWEFKIIKFIYFYVNFKNLGGRSKLGSAPSKGCGGDW